MKDRITFVGTYTLPEGRFEEWAEAITDMIDFVKASVPTIVSFDVFVDEAKREATSVYVHPTAESFEKHMSEAAARVDRGARMVDVQRIDIYGDPGPRVLERIRQVSDSTNHFPVNVKRHFYG